MSRRRIVFVPDDYRQACELGWVADDRVMLDTGRHPSGPGETWSLDPEEDTVTLVPPPKS